MKLNDPFNRVSKRQNGVYESLRKRWDAAGVADRGEAAKIGRDMRRTALQLIAIVVVSGLILGLLFPDVRGVLLVIGALVLVWTAGNFLLASMHLRRYVNEVLAGTSGDARSRGDSKQPPAEP